MTAYILKTVAGLVLLIIPVAGFFFQARIQQHYPAFDPALWATGSLFIGGMVYAVMARNIVIAIIVLVASVAIPFLDQWVVLYWPY
jgi:hypothetical protein